MLDNPTPTSRSPLMEATMFTRLALAATLALAMSVAHAQSQDQRVTGKVKSVAADHLVVSTEKADVDLLLTRETRISKSEKASAAQIKSGSYLGTANQNVEDGGRATEVHLADSGPDVHAPMNADGLMMTNGHVKSVHSTAQGQEMDIDYGKGTRHVVVPASTPITKMIPQDRTALTPGVRVTVFRGVGADGKQTARFVLLSAPQ